ncbi:hypothetical protein, partial [Actinomadura parmotrematis]
MNPLLPVLVSLETFLRDRIEARAERDDRGASAFEYAALIVVAAAIIGFLFTLIPGVKDAVSKAIDTMFKGGGGDAPPATGTT